LKDYQYGIKKINFIYNKEKNKCKLDTYSFTKNQSSDANEDESKKVEFDDSLGKHTKEFDPELDDDYGDEFSDDDDDDEDDLGEDLAGFGADDDDDFGDDDFFESISFFENIKDWVSEIFKLDIHQLKIFGKSQTIGDRIFAFAQKTALLKAIKDIEEKGIKFTSEPLLSLSTHNDTEVINKDNLIEWSDRPEEVLKTSQAIETFAMICFDSKEFRDLVK
jgi:hypothetical protein